MPYKMQYWNSSLKPYPYDLAKAKALLAKSKYPKGFKTFLIEVSNDVAGNATAVVIKSELAKIGIKVDIRTYELLTAYAKEDGGHSQMGQRYWTNDIIDPDEVTTFAVDPKGGANAFNTYWSNARATTSSTRRAPSARRPSVLRCTRRSSRSCTTRARSSCSTTALPVRAREVGARVPREPARQLQPVAPLADRRLALGGPFGRPALGAGRPSRHEALQLPRPPDPPDDPGPVSGSR